MIAIMLRECTTGVIALHRVLAAAPAALQWRHPGACSAGVDRGRIEQPISGKPGLGSVAEMPTGRAGGRYRGAGQRQGLLPPRPEWPFFTADWTGRPVRAT